MGIAVLYAIMCILMIYFNYRKHHRFIMTINIYLIIWSAMILFYSFKWIKYYDLSASTWLLVFFITILACIGYHFGTCLKLGEPTTNKKMEQKDIKKTILRLSLISMLAIIPNTFFLIQKYGINLLSKTAQIYYDNISGNAPRNIPYLSALAQVGCILSGIYFSRYKFSPIILLPVFLAMLSILPSGSRGGLILTVFFFVLPIILKDRGLGELMISKKEKKRKKRRIILMVLGVLFLFVILTISRSIQLDPMIYQYMSNDMLPVALVMPAVFKLYQYFASPIGVLNVFLREPDFYFGGNTFGPLYNIINKFGGNLEYQRYQKFYSIPIDTNVGTWIRELIQDFSIPGMVIVILVFCVAVGYFENKAIKYKNRDDIIMASVLGTILIMSFFVWYIREGTMQVILLSCIIMRLKIFDNRIALRGFWSK